MALMKKVLLPLCVLILTFMICVYIPSSTTSIITITSPKAMPPRNRPYRARMPSQDTNTSDDRGSFVRSLDSSHTTRPKQPPRVLSERDEIIANKQNSTLTTSDMVTKQMAARQYENKRTEIMDTVKTESETSTTSKHVISNVLMNGDEGAYAQTAREVTNDTAIQQDVYNKEEFGVDDVHSKIYNISQDEVKSNDESLRQLNATNGSIAVTSWVNQATSILSTGNDSSNENCKPITKIVFLKTHKTGSTTMASIFERFGYRRNLMFALPRSKHYFSFSSFFSRKGVVPLPQVLAISHPHFDILDNHAVYYRPEMEKTVPNATYITILRDPVTQLESSFGYFEMAKGMGISKHPNPLEMFMQNPHSYYDNDTIKYNMKARSRNGQLYDLGFINTKLFDNTNAILKKIDSLDKEFHLVLITEYFDESLILMKKQLCWSFDDIIYISNGIRSKSHRFTISDKLKTKIRQWNAGDVLLYNHFNRTLWQKIKDYGPTFQADLEEFRRLEKEALNRCVDTKTLDRHDKREDKFILNPEHSGKYCQDLLRADVPYTALLRKKMREISIRAVEKISLRRSQVNNRQKRRMRKPMSSKIMKR
ncbi:uncharacterized protein [Amphiura filiformis]|uniref:uncharacterized protein n=1 Tax=Amphiura filiformis TaxID=82378 RepID=UPI003B2156A3